ncbi:3-hydroxybutyryl-CoA dehydratase [Halobacteriales archaeon SW_7_68_16]|nr:MAG: 3-hydroxybutyryl-CoA dehydratase [Halobacteriales archaeon SW_7_68_16]
MTGDDGADGTADAGTGTHAEAATAGFETVRVCIGERAEGVATVTIDRPEARNALNGQVRSELTEALAAIEADDAAWVVVLTGGADAGAFVAGADVTELRDRDHVAQREASKRPRVYEVVAELDHPTVARINGHALGGGCELAQACDVRYALAGAKLGQPEIGLGIMPGGGATQRLPRLVGTGQAMRLILSGDPIDATEAAEIGLVEGVCADVAELDATVDDLAASIAGNSPLAVEYARTAVRAASRMGLDDGIDHEAELFASLFATRDKDEGIDAFLDDREPEWKGR